MSIFDFPRLHVRGLMSVNVGTANNDDYADMTVNATYDPVTGNPAMAPYKDLPMRLADTDDVQPDTWGQSDEGFNKWAASELEVTSRGKPAKVIPGEWNFYGSMGIDMEFDYPSIAGKNGTSYVTVASAQTAANTFYSSESELQGNANADSISPFLGAQLSYQKRTDYQHSTGMIIDCSQEGSSQSSMVIADNLMLRTPANQVLLGRQLDPNTGNYSGGGQPSMARTWWLNFQRNTNFPGPGGAAGTFQHVVMFEDGLEYAALKTYFERNRPSWETRPIAGVVYRWTMFRCSSQLRNDNEALMELYKKGGINPAVGVLVGTLAPWYAGDQTEPFAMGRLLQPFCTAGWTPTSQPGSFSVPTGSQGNGAPTWRLAPMVLRAGRGYVSIDVSNTFPEVYDDPDSFEAYHDDSIPATTRNPKYDLGTLTLIFDQQRGQPITVGTFSFDGSGTVSYGTEAFYNHGGMVDIPLSGDQWTEEFLQGGTFKLVNADKEALLYEPELMITSVQSTSYCEQEPGGGTTRVYNYAGKQQGCQLTVYKAGRPLSEQEYQQMVRAGKGLEVVTWKLNPLQLQGTANKNPIARADVPSLSFSLQTDVTHAGTNITAVFPKNLEPLYGGPVDDQTKLDFMVNPLIYVRILPNEDYSQYYEDPTATELVGNKTLQFGVIYEKIFRNYFMLYPVMSQMVPMNDPQEWANPNMCRKLLERINSQDWLSYQYMPRTRDLSRSRTELLTAFANAVIKYPDRYVS